MSVESIYTRVIAQGDGANIKFGFQWKFIDESDIVVYVDDALIPSSEYSLEYPITKTSGSVVFNTAPAVGAIVVIKRAVNEQQSRMFKNTAQFNANEVEKAFDKLTMLVQEQLEDIRRQALTLASQSNIDWKVEDLTEDDVLLAVDFDAKKLIQTSFTQEEVQAVIDEAVRSMGHTVKNIEWDGSKVTFTFGNGAMINSITSPNVAQLRAVQNEKGGYLLQWSLDGIEWLHSGSIDVASIIEEAKGIFYTKTEIDNKVAVINTATDANADAIQKTREDYIEADSEIHQILNAHASELTTQRNDIDDLGDQVAEIESKIPETASAENPLVTRSEISSVYKFKGSVATYNDLPTGATVGDVYNVTDTGANYAWDGSAWDKLSETVDLSSYATTAYVNAIEQDIRADINEADSQLQTQITAQAESITTLRNDTDDLGEQVANIESKIPDGTSDTNPLINKQQLLDEEMDIREDLNSGLSELQTQITAQATAIAGKQDQLTAGDNITIVDNVISATGGGGGDFLPLAGGTMTGNINFEYGLGAQFIGASEANGGILIFTRNSSDSRNAYYYFEIFGFYGRNTNGNYNLNLGNNNFPWGRAYIQKINSGNGGADIIVPAEGGTLARLEDLADIGGGGGIANVVHDTTLTGSGTDSSPLGLAETIKDEIASKAPTATVEALTQVVNGIIGDYVKKTGDTMTGALNVPEITVQTAEGTFTVSVVAGVVTIATNNGLDFASPVKFDTAPTTDDNTTYANALDTSLVRKAQVATAIADAMANVDALPDQTGNAGKVLTTDGTNASWTEMSGLIIRRL